MNDISQDNLSIRDKVNLAEKYLKSLPQRELKVEHHFSFGVYARILYIPADTVLTGKLHKFPQINLLRQGDISVLVGTKVKRLKAPFVVASPAGTKRIAYTHKDTVWVTVHGTSLNNVDEIERTFIAQDEQEYLEFIDRTDYFQIISEYGFDENTVRKISENTLDMVELPLNNYKFSIKSSSIEGLGIISNDFIFSNEIIGPARINNMRTVLGRYTNHSHKANAQMVLKNNNDIDLVSIKHILKNEEITINYRQAAELPNALRGSQCLG